MMHYTIPYGRTLTINYFLLGANHNPPDPLVKLSPYELDLILVKGNDYDNTRNAWVATTIANRLQGDSRTFEGVLVPKDDVFTITSTTGDVLRFKLYNNVLVEL